MTDKVELKSCHEVIDTVDVADIVSIFHGNPTVPDILTVIMKDGKRLYCDEVCPMREEPVSIWHDANQQPTMYRKYLVRYSDGSVSGSWERHDDGFISWEDEAKEHGSFTHWCYVKDLLKL